MKTRLMQEIASEYGVEWDSKSLDQNLYKLPSSEHVRSYLFWLVFFTGPIEKGTKENNISVMSFTGSVPKCIW